MHAWRLLISPVSTRRRISAHASMSVYTPASCRMAFAHGRDRYRTAATALERYTSGSADRSSASAALLDRRLYSTLHTKIRPKELLHDGGTKRDERRSRGLGRCPHGRNRVRGPDPQGTADLSTQVQS